jgi:hypothetical protein
MILQASTADGGMSVIDIVPIENADSGESSPVHGNMAVDPLETNNDDDGQQVTAQVAVIQGQSPNNSGPHYITVTGN